MNNTNCTVKRICMVGIFSAMYAVFSAMVKVPLIGHTYLDTGYIVLTVAAILMPPLDTAIVGVMGCGVVDILSNPYGFSFTHALFNFIVGVSVSVMLYGKLRKKENMFSVKHIVAFVVAVAATCFVGIFIKSALECYIYGIAPLVKLPKAVLAFLLDTATISLSYPVAVSVRRVIDNSKGWDAYFLF